MRELERVKAQIPSTVQSTIKYATIQHLVGTWACIFLKIYHIVDKHIRTQTNKQQLQ